MHGGSPHRFSMGFQVHTTTVHATAEQAIFHHRNVNARRNKNRGDGKKGRLPDRTADEQGRCKNRIIIHAATIVFGLTFATLLTLFVTPALYAIFYKIELK